jgi:glucose-1-phosphate adenylyltransferase
LLHLGQDDARVVRSTLGRGVRVGPGAVVTGAIIMDHTEVGPGARVSRSIVDRYNTIPAGARLEPDGADDAGLEVHRDVSGIAVVPRGEPAGPVLRAV